MDIDAVVGYARLWKIFDRILSQEISNEQRQALDIINKLRHSCLNDISQEEQAVVLCIMYPAAYTPRES